MKTYNIIPAINTIKFVREAEFKYKIRILSDEAKIKELFDCYDLLRNNGTLDSDIIDVDCTYLDNSD